MARRKFGERSIRKLIKLGRGSIGVTLPIELVRALRWRGKQKVGPTTSLRVNGAAARERFGDCGLEEVKTKDEIVVVEIE